MSEFTVTQYDKAIKALQAAQQQVSGGDFERGCAICAGQHHPDSCEFNPLNALHLFQQATRSRVLPTHHQAQDKPENQLSNNTL